MLKLSVVPAFRLWVRRRLLLDFTLIGGLTPILLVILSQVRTRALRAAEKPEAILDNLILVQLFILAVGLVAGVITAVLVARAIVGPLKVLQEAMGRVEKNELNTRIVVTTNDELSFCSTMHVQKNSEAISSIWEAEKKRYNHCMDEVTL